MIKLSQEIYLMKFNYYGGKDIITKPDIMLRSSIDFSNPRNLEGCILKTSNNENVTLQTCIGFGGEGCVYLLSEKNMVAKIFSDMYRTQQRKEKIELMCKIVLEKQSVVWPKDTLYDSSGEFVGYLMELVPTARGMMDLEDVLKNVSVINHLTKKQMIETIIAICETVDYLHSQGIVVGDLKLENIIFRKEDAEKNDFSKPLFLGCDSYQIEKYPCNVFTDSYQAPEWHPSTMKYRGFEYDLYSLYVVIFKILFRRMLPHSRIRLPNELDQNKLDSAKSGVFPYSVFDEEYTDKWAPKVGGCAALWSHLPEYIKQALFDAGDKKAGKNYGPQNRITAAKWAELFKRYLADIECGKLSVDEEYNVGYPVNKISYSLLK